MNTQPQLECLKIQLRYLGGGLSELLRYSPAFRGCHCRCMMVVDVVDVVAKTLHGASGSVCARAGNRNGNEFFCSRLF